MEIKQGLYYLRQRMYAGSTIYIKYPVYPTGRWKFSTGPYYTRKLFIEASGRKGDISFLCHGDCNETITEWFDEDELEILPAKEETIYDCNKREDYE